MSRPEGLPKTGGRKKGTPNAKTRSLEESLRRHDIDLVEQIAKTLPQLDPDKRAEVLIDMLAYLYPKRKTVEERPLGDPQRAQVVIHMPSNGREAKDTEIVPWPMPAL